MKVNRKLKPLEVTLESYFQIPIIKYCIIMSVQTFNLTYSMSLTYKVESMYDNKPFNTMQLLLKFFFKMDTNNIQNFSRKIWKEKAIWETSYREKVNI
jgi:hypothetical protein